jgi:hypothetical protein
MIEEINRAHLLLHGDPDRSLVCGVCHDLYHDPILCSAGHSWCRHCMRGFDGLGNSKCPLCPAIVNVTSAPRNLSLQSMIDGMLVRCPHNQSVGAKRARIEDGTGAGVGAGAAFSKSTEDCNWSGKMENLATHLAVCQHKPNERCAFAEHGCTFVGTKKAMDLHYFSAAHEHSAIVSRKFAALEKSIANLSAKIDAGPSENRLSSIATERFNSLARSECLYPGTLTILWSIYGSQRFCWNFNCGNSGQRWKY